MGDVGLLPLHKMTNIGEKREKDRNHRLWWLFTQQPNDMQTPAMWKETMIQWSLLWGNAICYIDRAGPLGSKVEQLIPLLPDRTGYIKENGKYLIRTWINDQYYLLHPSETFHIRGLATNGFWGESAIQIAKNVIGHGIALRKHGNATFKNGAMPKGVMTVVGKLNKEQRDDLRNEWNAIYGGIDEQGKIAILQQGATLSPFSVSNVDSQWLEASKLDREFVAALFNLPNHKLNALENAAVRANLEEQNLQYLMMSLARHLNKIKEEAERKLLTEKERRSGEHYMRWVVDAFLRGNIKDRYEAYSKGRAGGWLSPNEIREFDDMNPFDGGDDHTNPAINPADKSTDDKEQSKQADKSARKVVGQIVEAMLTAEENKVSRAAKGADNFVAWLDSFYAGYLDFAREFLAGPIELVAHVRSVANWEYVIREHAEHRKAGLLEIAGYASKATLPELATSYSAVTSAAKLTASILGD
jgi:HK97 family phage portal protein